MYVEKKKAKIEHMLKSLRNKEHHKYRQTIDPEILKTFTEGLFEKGLSPVRRAAKRLAFVFDMEKPVVLQDERIVFLRTVDKIPEVFTVEEWQNIRKQHYIHESGKVCNISPDYASTINVGLEQRKLEALESLKSCKDPEAVDFLESVIDVISSVEKLVERYAVEAEKVGNEEAASILKRVPRFGARTFQEALQFFRILHFTLWCSGNYHNTIGRFDQYMYPYLQTDLAEGRLNAEEAFELLEEFFITFNKDSDLYPGMQQGDNGQSMVLGGVDKTGRDAYNLLSEMCLKASLELRLIDPKINLRVHKDTPLETFELGTRLTKQGLGFPQYSNDEVVIPGLVMKGYDLEDARNYVVAACWEFIIPAVGMDIPNIGALSFVKVVNECVKKYLAKCVEYEEFMGFVKSQIQREIDEEIRKFRNIYLEPSPFMSVLMEGCIENARDISWGNKYNNYGLHGTGIASAADSLAAVKKNVFEDKSVSPEEMLSAIQDNFIGHEFLLSLLKQGSPKMGNDDDYVDDIAKELLNIFADCLENRKNERGGCFRAGTGSAMYYLLHTKDLDASPDGRKKGEPLSANYSPSLNVKVAGPISVISSFSKPDLKRVVNGGPLTLELHDTVFRNEESIGKVAMLVKSYMDMGGHQLQLNSVNSDQLKEAQKNPERYRNLIVRVWGWSGYFVELDKEYQDHIIQRAELLIT